MDRSWFDKLTMSGLEPVPLMLSLMCHSERSEESHSMDRSWFDKLTMSGLEPVPLILSLMCHSERSEESHSMTLALRKAECHTLRSLAGSG
jgi:hypothetical protein